MPSPAGHHDTANPPRAPRRGRPGAVATRPVPDRLLAPLVLAAALSVLLILLPAPSARADGTGAAPQPSVTLPDLMDLPVDYEGQTVCDPAPKPGANALKDLLLRTYGASTIWIPRACDQGGQSEHKEGRALDWMVGTKPSALKTAAESFLAWVTAPDAAGVPGAMARRMGIMYIGWDDRIWRAYDTARGWTELKGCFSPSMQGSGNDTYCHRDHVHISLSWDGAAGLTSFWDGSATDVAACERRTSPVPVGSLGSATDPAVVLNTATGRGVASRAKCRLAADRWSGDARRISIALPMGGSAATVHLRVGRFASNAPSTLRLSSTTGATTEVKAGTPLPADLSLAVGADGVVTFSVNAGSAFVRVASFGTGAAPAPAPGPTADPAPSPTPSPTAPSKAPAPPAATARVSMSGPTYVRVRSPLTLHGTVTDAPAGAVVRRLVRSDGAWVPTGKKVQVKDGAWSATFTEPSPRLLRFRAALMVGDREISRSPRRDVRVLPTTTDLVKRPIVTLDAASYVDSGGTLTLSGRVQAPPAGATVQRLLRVDGAWRPLGDPVPVANGAWSMPVSVPPPPRTLRYRAQLLVNGATVSVSPRADVRVVRPTG